MKSFITSKRFITIEVNEILQIYKKQWIKNKSIDSTFNPLLFQNTLFVYIII